MTVQAKSSPPTIDAQLIVEAVENADLGKFEAGDALNVLSTHTHVDGIEVDPAGIVWEGSRTFRGLVSIYVLLVYGGKGDDRFEETDAFSGEFEGHVDKHGKPHIDRITADTSPFFDHEPSEDSTQNPSY